MFINIHLVYNNNQKGETINELAPYPHLILTLKNILICRGFIQGFMFWKINYPYLAWKNEMELKSHTYKSQGYRKGGYWDILIYGTIYVTQNQ